MRDFGCLVGWLPSGGCLLENGLGNWEWLWSVVEKVMGNVLGYGKLL